MLKEIKNKMLCIILRVFLNIDNFVYSKISKFAVLLEDGIHPKHRLMKYHDFFLNNIDSSDTVLDVGCGNGSVAYDIARKAKSVTGIDIYENNIEYAKKNFLKDNVEYIYGDIMSRHFSSKFDVIILSNVLEHIEDRIGLLERLKKLGDKILIRVPMIDRSWVVLYKKELGIEYRLDKTHRIEYTFKDFDKEIKSAGLKIENYSVQFGEIWAVLKK
jgi:SAM-dependent methyltransferase